MPMMSKPPGQGPMSPQEMMLLQALVGQDGPQIDPAMYDQMKSQVALGRSLPMPDMPPDMGGMGPAPSMPNMPPEMGGMSPPAPPMSAPPPAPAPPEMGGGMPDAPMPTGGMPMMQPEMGGSTPIGDRLMHQGGQMLDRGMSAKDAALAKIMAMIGG